MKKLYSLFAAAILGITSYHAQYCSPSFLNGCINWTNQHIEVGGIMWDNTDCSVSDYTTSVGTITKGVASDMVVTNGAWCGVGVWLDFNNDYNFSDDENLYHIYNAGDPQTYNFQITVPTSVSDGSYRLRIIAGWGTDCFDATSTNGYGACGEYQYGNFNDFTLNVVSPANVTSAAAPSFSVFPNPTGETTFLRADAGLMGETYFIMNSTGQIVAQSKLSNTTTSVDMSGLASGIYQIRVGQSNATTVTLIKQ